MEAQIYLLKSAKSNKVDRVLFDATRELPKKEYQVSDLLIQDFKKLKLQNQELQTLSFEARRKVKEFLDLEKNWLEKMASQLMSEVNKLKRKTIHLKADNVGSFICLYALRYFKLEEGKELILHLLDCPVRLFEKYIARLTKGMNTERIHCQIKKSSWLYPLHTLYETEKIPNLKAA